MLRAILNWLRRRSGGDAGSDTGERGDSGDGGPGSGDGNGDESDGGFTPSRLDASVLESHGMGTPEAERELASIQEKARTLDSERPDDRER